MTEKYHLLVVEDEPAISRGLTDVFVYHGYDVDTVADGRQGLEQALGGGYDLVLLDIMLPSMNGFDVCNSIRDQQPDLPIIMLTARVSDEDIVKGLTVGADDYVAKPFSVEQLVLRVKAVLRRTAAARVRVAQIELGDDQVVDIDNLEFRRGADSVRLTRREADILAYLNGQSGRAVNRTELLTEVWGYNHPDELETRTVDIHIAKLRRKVERDAKRPKLLETVRGAGYRLNANDSDA